MSTKKTNDATAGESFRIGSEEPSTDRVDGALFDGRLPKMQSKDAREKLLNQTQKRITSTSKGEKP